MSYKTLNKFLVEQEIFFDNDAIVLINHHTCRTGARVFLQDLANWLVDEGKKVVWLDVHPSDCFDLNPAIQKIYYFNNSNILKDILDANDPMLIYSNSTSRLIIDHDMFDRYLDRTIVHLHETYYDLYSVLKKTNRTYAFIGQSKATFWLLTKKTSTYHQTLRRSANCTRFMHPTREKDFRNSKRTTKINV